MRVITPKPLKIVDNIEKKIAERLRRYVPLIIEDFNSTTENWEHAVTFRYEVRRLASKNVSMKVWTDDEIWNYVNGGTKPHDIWAGFYTGKSDKKYLAFAPGSVPKTLPGVLKSGPGKPGVGMRYAPYVRHPGTKARRFDEVVKLKHAGPLFSEIRDAIRTAVMEQRYA